MKKVYRLIVFVAAFALYLFLLKNEKESSANRTSNVSASVKFTR